jgi:D-alanyl-D-alanine carboxypeptidase
MKIRLASAILASLAVFVSMPDALHAPTVFASPTVVAPVPPDARKPSAPILPAKFAGSLPVADEVKAPHKIVGADGRESLGLKLTATRVYVVDERSGAPLYDVAGHEKTPLASITKLMTARVFRSRGVEWDKVVTMSGVVPDGGVPYFADGDQITVRDLWKAMLIGSSNTAALTLSKLSGLSPEGFADEMNAQAAALGMGDTRFVEPTGLDEHNVSSAADIATLSRAEFADPEVKAVVSLPDFELQKIKGVSRRVISTDKLVGSFLAKSPYRLLGAKTGYITESGYNIVISVTRDGASPITVVLMGAASNDLRFQEAKSVAYWAFENYAWPDDRVAIK